MSRRRAFLAYALLGLLTAAALGGCEDSSVGTLQLAINGVPVQGAQNVVLAINDFTVGGDGGQTEINPNLLGGLSVDLEGGRTGVISGALVPAGYYQWIRLNIDPQDSYVIASDGNRYSLQVPAEMQIDGPFLVGQGQVASLMIQINLNLALSYDVQGGVRVYTLQPLTQLVDLHRAHNILGTVPPDYMVGSLLITDPRCDAQVYAFPGLDAVPEGYFVAVKGGTLPYISTSISLNARQGLYVFNLQSLPSGNYTVAVTCAAEDIPGSGSIVFSPAQNVRVTARSNAIVHF